MLAVCAPDDPAGVAVDFLEKVRAGSIDLKPGADTALSSNTAEEKRREIARRLQRTARDLDGGTLEAAEVKQDEDYAAVIVRKADGFDPTSLRVFAVAVVRRGGIWQPAPVLASFENSGAGHALALRKRLEALESWMLRQQVLDLQTIREQATERMRGEIRKQLTEDQLHEMQPTQVGRRFIEACGKRELPVILGLLGGLQPRLPDDWSSRLRFAENAMRAEDGHLTRPWRLLVSPQVLRAVVHQERTSMDGLVSLGCMDPAGIRPERPSTPRLEIIHLPIRRQAEGLWQVNPPPAFFMSGENAANETFDDEMDEELHARFPQALRSRIPAVRPTDLSEAARSLETALRSATPDPLFALAGLDGDSAAVRQGCAEILEHWQAMHEATTVRHLVFLGSHQVGSIGVTAFQFCSVTRPERMDVRLFHWLETDEGFEIALHGSAEEPKAGPIHEIKLWLDSRKEDWSRSWRDIALKNSVKLEKVGELEAPAEAEARATVEAWLEAARTGNPDAALAHTAWLADDRGSSLALTNLGYEINGIRKAGARTSITHVFRGKTWTAVAVRSRSGGKSTYPLYPIISTPAGPRLLVELDLFAKGNRGRDYLNNRALTRVAGFTTPEAAAELRQLFSDFKKTLDEPVKASE